VQEVLNVITTKMKRPVRRALETRARYGYGFYDSLIVAAAMHHGCSTLYSEDMQHDRLIDTVRILDPFRASGTSQS